MRCLFLDGSRSPSEDPDPAAGARSRCWRPIPLLAPDPEVVVDLGQVFATAYQRGRYQRAVDDTAEPQLLLAEEDLQWIKAQTAR